MLPFMTGGLGRRVAAVLAAGVAVVTVGSASAVLRADSDAVHRVDLSSQERHLPESVNAPGTWSDEEGVRGPVAALGIATRTRADGVFDEKQSLGLFAVSAVDGSASWIRLPGFSLDRSGFAGGFDVSPDGQWIGWERPHQSVRPGEMGGRVTGWAVMNTVTGAVRRLDDPQFPWVRRTVADLKFSGDSRYLLTSYETPEAARSRGHQFVAWDVEDGSPTVIEKPGHYWLPNLGSAPRGVVWARDARCSGSIPSPASTARSRCPTTSSPHPGARTTPASPTSDDRPSGRVHRGASTSVATYIKPAAVT